LPDLGGALYSRCACRVLAIVRQERRVFVELALLGHERPQTGKTPPEFIDRDAEGVEPLAVAAADGQPVADVVEE
jgi:hypothetical protein